MEHISYIIILFVGIMLGVIGSKIDWPYMIAYFIRFFFKKETLVRWRNNFYKKQFSLPPKVKLFKCTKSYYKSTYLKNAFSKGRTYKVSREDDEFFYIQDNEFHDFSISKTNKFGLLFIDDYFKPIIE